MVAVRRMWENIVCVCDRRTITSGDVRSIMSEDYVHFHASFKMKLSAKEASTINLPQ